MVRVTPTTFSMVNFDPDEIVGIAETVLAAIDGLGDVDVEIVVDEDQPTTRMAITSLDPLTLAYDSGALEDSRHPRHLGPEMASVSIAALLLEYLDRRSEDFGAPALGEPTDLAQKVAWSASIHGRVQRLGFRVHKPKHLYNFRTRHGFSDAADAAFEALWADECPSWSSILERCPPAS